MNKCGFRVNTRSRTNILKYSNITVKIKRTRVYILSSVVERFLISSPSNTHTRTRVRIRSGDSFFKNVKLRTLANNNNDKNNIIYRAYSYMNVFADIGVCIRGYVLSEN